MRKIRQNDKPLRIVHDWDLPYLNGRWALKRGLKLILYAFSKKLPLLKRFVKDIYDETHRYCITLNKLDELLGITPHWGIRREVYSVFPSLKKKLKGEIHLHIHNNDGTVSWHPPLNPPFPMTWDARHFDQYYQEGVRYEYDWYVWHVDYPYILPKYIDFLYSNRHFYQ